MEIGPIAGIRAVVAMKPRPVDPELTALFEVESSARPGDDTYTGNGRKAAGAEENDENEIDEGEADEGEADENEAEAIEESSADEASSYARPESSAGQISFFA